MINRETTEMQEPRKPRVRRRSKRDSLTPAPQPGSEKKGAGRDQLLDQITLAAKNWRELESEFGSNPPPELETLIKLYRVIILQISTQANCNPDTTRLVTNLIKPVMEWARIQEQRKERELAEMKYRDQKAALEKEAGSELENKGLALPTLEKIEKALKLM